MSAGLRPARRGQLLNGTGSPGGLLLDAWGAQLHRAYGTHPYLTGTATRGKQWRDVDVRLILDDEEWERRFPDVTPGRAGTDPEWSLLCIAISLWGQQQTGLPIDFQFQQQTAANERFNGPRFALGIYFDRGDS